MSLLRGFICQIRGPLLSQPEGPVDPFPPHLTAHQTPTSPKAITQPSSGSSLHLRRGHRYRRPSVTATQHSAWPERRITTRRAAGGPPNS
ncbi:hypothetical protein NDU88_001046 [Pleurodeles waltl]|uniref:Uncharacterized protein n=1 Tax=Pleurodeles waltl TaxID=8319 RepID=A0AAV7R7G2_PLEWA|nr:hypothetical protein NDU88_001046 [Pleurodeles waltl]